MQAISIQALVGYWVRHLRWVLLSVGLMLAITYTASTFLKNVYRSEALLAPNVGENSSALSSLAAQYGGLAGLAGIDLGAGGGDNTDYALAVLQSRKFITEFVIRRDLRVPLIAADKWDVHSGELKIDADIYDLTTQKWVREVDPPLRQYPTDEEVFREFTKILAVNVDNETGFIRLTAEHISPEHASDWVSWLVDDLNQTIMRRDVAEAEQSIEYLKAQIESTSLAELKAVFFKLIEEQTKTMMLARVSSEYAFKVIDPAVRAEEHHKPNRILIAVLGAMLGLLIALCWLTVTGLDEIRRRTPLNG